MSNRHNFKDSTSIAYVDFHEPDTLEIKFGSGATYHYDKCPKSHYEGMKKAESPGKYFRSHILNGFAHKRID